MDNAQYQKIRAFTIRNLHQSLHSRHLDDCIQSIAEAWWMNGGMGNLRWMLCDYLRTVGIGRRGKQGAKTIEMASFVGYDSDDGEGDCGYLLDQGQTLEFEESCRENDQRDELEAVRRFLKPRETGILYDLMTGASKKDISIDRQVSFSRISQIVTNAKEKIGDMPFVKLIVAKAGLSARDNDEVLRNYYLNKKTV